MFEIQHAKLPGGKGVEKGDGLGGGDSVDHPNRYFDASRKVIREAKDSVKKEDDGGAADGADVKPVVSGRKMVGVKKEEAMDVDS